MENTPSICISTRIVPLSSLQFLFYHFASVTLGARDFSCAVSCFRAVQIVEQHSRKNLSWNPGYGQARLRSVRAIVTVVAFSFLNLPVSLLLTINRRYLNCCSNSFLSLHDCVVEHIYYNSISCC